MTEETAWIAALRLDDPLEALGRRAGRNRAAHTRVRIGARVSHPPEYEHPRGQLERHVDQILRSAALRPSSSRCTK